MVPLTSSNTPNESGIALQKKDADMIWLENIIYLLYMQFQLPCIPIWCKGKNINAVSKDVNQSIAVNYDVYYT